jgi:hypothetical protein
MCFYININLDIEFDGPTRACVCTCGKDECDWEGSYFSTEYEEHEIKNIPPITKNSRFLITTDNYYDEDEKKIAVEALKELFFKT